MSTITPEKPTYARDLRGGQDLQPGPPQLLPGWTWGRKQPNRNALTSHCHHLKVIILLYFSPKSLIFFMWHFPAAGPVKQINFNLTDLVLETSFASKYLSHCPDDGCPLQCLLFLNCSHI